MEDSASTTSLDASPLRRPDLQYSIVLLLAAIVTVSVLAAGDGLLADGYGIGTAAFFLAFGLFAIATGFTHPGAGYVSFDRIAQVSSVLVLGPLDAAWVNGLASFIYPWQRLRHGEPLPSVVTASLHNAGLMTFVVLGGGYVFTMLGGSIPLGMLDLPTAILLVALIIGMQVINDLGMMLVLYLRRSDPRLLFSPFTAAVEYVSGAAGILLAFAYTSQTMAFFTLLLLVLAAGMFVIMQYARMRNRLEKLVEERTEALKVQAKEFERQATHDKLTGLPNRRRADHYLKQRIEHAERRVRSGAVALADVDHFKRINDSYSHAVGDQVLERVARILSDGCRRSDFVARYGGEEFLLYFPDTEAGTALEICGELRVAVQDADWSDIAPEFGVTISFGLAEIGDEARCTTILSKADKHLYRAKREGRNRVIAA